MKTRLIVAFSLLPFFLLVLLVLPPVWTAVMVGGMSVLAAWELLHETKLLSDHPRLIWESMAMAVAVCVWSYFDSPAGWGALGLWLFFMVLMLEMLASHAKLNYGKVCIAAISGIVIPLCYTALLRMLLSNLGKYYIVVSLILAFTADSGAYFAGRYFGKHKLAPIISPKKTVEGAIGGVASAILFMVIYGVILEQCFHLEFNYFYAAIYGIIGSLSSIVGDLTFSVIKRQCGLKDYGKLLPGHGGILDRFDSTAVVAPLTEILMIFIPVLWM